MEITTNYRIILAVGIVALLLLASVVVYKNNVSRYVVEQKSDCARKCFENNASYISTINLNHTTNRCYCSLKIEENIT